MTKPRRQITQEERRPRIIRPSALPLGDRAARERLSVHRLRKSIKAAPLYARLRAIRTAIIAAADAARADRSRIEAVLKRAGVEFIDENGGSAGVRLRSLEWRDPTLVEFDKNATVRAGEPGTATKVVRLGGSDAAAPEHDHQY